MASTSLPTAPLGRTGLTVTRLAFGTSGLGDMPGTYGYGVDEERAAATLKAIFDGPVSLLDTSRIYGFGRSEDRIGHAIREHGGLPAGFVLSTKLDRDPRTNRFDAAQARRSLEESLAALGLERIDLMHLHDPEHSDSFEETCGPGGALEALFRMKEEGLVRAVGLAAGRVDLMLPLLRQHPFDALITHNRFTLVNRNAEEMIAFAHGAGMAVLNAAPYAGGVLAKGSASYQRYVYQEASDAMLQPVRQVEAICARHGVPPGAVALQFSMADPRITSTICGVTKPERVRQTIEWAQWPIPDAVWQDLAGLSVSHDDPEATRDYRPG
ncbi:MAG: aldo/keto reductase [Alsobacter sp.]